MAMHGSSRTCSGAEHKFSHGLNKIMAHPPMHGISVAIGSLISLQAYSKENKEAKRYLEDFKNAYDLIDLPTKIEDLNKLGLTKEVAHKAIDEAIKIKPERYTILDKITSEKYKDAFEEVYL